MIKPSRIPSGYKNLLVYKKAEELQLECSKLTALFPFSKTLASLADQMNRSARSGKQNIVEGWKRNSTKEYYDFLGFSIGANKELEEDCDDIWKGFYPALMGLKGIMGEKGAPSAPLIPLTPLHPLSDNANSSESHYTPLIPLPPFDIEKLKFYPMDKTLPPIVQLKLRCKELDYLFHKLQVSLVDKMEKEKTLSSNDKYIKVEEEKQKQEKFVADLLLENNL